MIIQIHGAAAVQNNPRGILSFATAIAEAGIVLDHRVGAHENSVHHAAKPVAVLPRRLRCDPLAFARIRGNLAVQCSGEFTDHIGRLRQNAREKGSV